MITHRNKTHRRGAPDDKDRRAATYRAAAALAVIVLAALLGINGEPPFTTTRDALGLQRDATPLPAMLEDAYRREMIARASPTGHYEGKRIVDYVTYG